MQIIKLIHLKCQKGFNFLGRFIYRWRCILITLLLSIGFLRFNEINNIKDQFGAENAPSRYEYNVAREYFKELGSLFHLVVAMQANDEGNLLRPNKTDKSGAVKLTYPSIDIFGHQIYLGNNFFKVQVNNRSGIIEYIGLIVLYFPVICPNKTIEQITKKWELAVLEYSKNTQTNSLIKICLTSEGLVSEEVRKTGTEVIPLMPVSIIAMILFTVLTSLKSDKTSSKGYTALFGLLSIGVDDGFIMLHCWGKTNNKLTVEERCAEMLQMAGPSMTITSLTNFLSFTIGMWTNIPAIRIFCTFVSISVLFAYFFQLFFYTSIMAISGNREAVLLKKIYFIDSKEIVTESDKFNNRIDQWLNIILNFYINFILSPISKLILIPILLIYYLISIWGIYNLGIGLTTEKLFHQDSLLLQLYHLQTQIIFKESGQMQIFVNNPGDLRNTQRLSDLMFAIKSFEQLPNSVGSESTHLWLKSFIPFIGFKENGSMEFKYKYIYEFLSMQEYKRWNQFIRLGKQIYCIQEKPECIQKFFFSTSFRGAISWNQKLELIKNWRKLANKFNLFNLTIFEIDSIFTDQLLIIPPVTIQTVLLALLCMCFVLALFTPSFIIIFIGSFAVLSINLGVFGFLYFWNINLDPISMITTLTAIGISVDFVAHISFHYYNSGYNELKQKERLKYALKSIGWPMLQAGLSTFLCVLVLAIINVYIVQVFVKVVFLVVLLGLIHGLLILPIAYSSILILFNNNNNLKLNNKIEEKNCNENIQPTKIFINDIYIYKYNTKELRINNNNQIKLYF